MRGITGLTRAAVLALAAGGSFAGPLDLERVTLYRSGVGSFEWRGVIEGDDDIALRFERDRINDILKSMVLLDTAGGRIEAVGYDSKEPLERRLSGFAIDVRKSSLYGLLEQVRGTGVRMTVGDATAPTTGVVVGLEQRSVSEEGATTRVGFVNLLTDSGLRSIDLRLVRDVDILDDRLAAEMREALAVLAESRGDDSATVDVRFRGDGVRPVIVSYVHEAPVWKTSYRLVLPDESSRRAGDEATLQGWAIVENTTDEDWTDIGLTLVSGRPVGFTMDLYEPLFLPRPEVPVPVEGAALSRVYQEGVERATAVAGRGVREAAVVPAPAMSRGRGDWSTLNALPAPDGRFLGADELANYAPGAKATAAQRGELFVFELDEPVTIERRRSAMIPIVTAPVSTRRVSIYSEGDLAAHPMRGVEVTNDSGLKLMPGPVTVFDAGAFAGDAQIGSAGEDEERLLAYAVDLDVSADVDRRRVIEVTGVSIAGRALRRTRASRETIVYTFDNASSSDRVVIVEVPKRPGYEPIGRVQPDEETASAYRFEVEVEAKDAGELSVTLERVQSDTVALSPERPFDTLVRELRGQRVSARVVQAIEEAARLQEAVRRGEQRVSAVELQRTRLFDEQARVRSNLAAVARGSDLHARYLGSLSTLEDELDALTNRRREAEAAVEAARGALTRYLDALRIG